MVPDENAGLYVISVAAELAGVHPQTLRLYERKGLLEPARTDGGNRLYSDRDLALLRHIAELTSTGVNLQGVRRILELEHALAATKAELERARDEYNSSAQVPHRGGTSAETSESVAT